MAITYYHVTVNGAGDASGDSWANAMAMSDFITDYEGGQASGDVYYFKAGTYTMGEDVYGQADATAAEPVRLIGVLSGTTNEGANVATTDWATAGDRPVFAMGAYFIFMRNYHMIFNIDFTGTDVFIHDQEKYATAFNCKSYNSSGTPNRAAFYMGDDNCAYVGCEAQSDAGYGIQNIGGHWCRAVACDIHDSVVGIQTDIVTNIVGCVIDTCSTYGIEVGSYSGCLLYNNSIYNCGTGVYGTTGGGNVFVNNIIDACTTGANWTTDTPSNLWAYNCWDNTTDRTNVTGVTNGFGRVTADPGMNNPAGRDFSIDTADNADNVGLDAGDLAGATV